VGFTNGHASRSPAEWQQRHCHTRCWYRTVADAFDSILLGCIHQSVVLWIRVVCTWLRGAYVFEGLHALLLMMSITVTHTLLGTCVCIAQEEAGARLEQQSRW
jgi:hypothetical protein